MQHTHFHRIPFLSLSSLFLTQHVQLHHTRLVVHSEELDASHERSSHERLFVGRRSGQLHRSIALLLANHRVVHRHVNEEQLQLLLLTLSLHPNLCMLILLFDVVAKRVPRMRLTSIGEVAVTEETATLLWLVCHHFHIYSSFLPSNPTFLLPLHRSTDIALAKSIGHTIHETLSELHEVGGECSRLIGEDVSDLSEIVVKCGGANTHRLVIEFIVPEGEREKRREHLEIVLHEESLHCVHDRECNVKRHGNELVTQEEESEEGKAEGDVKVMRAEIPVTANNCH